MNKYTGTEKEILADLSLKHGTVELRITTEGTDGDLVPEFVIIKALGGVIRGLIEDGRIADMNMDYGEIRITPIPRGLQTAAKDRKATLEECTTAELAKELWNRAGRE